MSAHLRSDDADGVRTLTIVRPPVNALTVQLCLDLAEACDAGVGDEVRCVILAADGSRAFSAGLDLAEFFATTGDEAGRATAVRRMYEAVYRCRVPVIAALNGPAVGAGSVLASVCDMRIASAAVFFSLPEVNVGRIGGAAHHGRLLPQAVLRRMVFTGAPLSAADAYRLGFVDELVPTDALLAARAVAATISNKSSVVVRHLKRAMNEVEGMGFEEGYAHEQSENAALRRTDDAREASRAALEHRPPSFNKGR